MKQLLQDPVCVDQCTLHMHKDVSDWHDKENWNLLSYTGVARWERWRAVVRGKSIQCKRISIPGFHNFCCSDCGWRFDKEWCEIRHILWHFSQASWRIHKIATGLQYFGALRKYWKALTTLFSVNVFVSRPVIPLCPLIVGWQKSMIIRTLCEKIFCQDVTTMRNVLSCAIERFHEHTRCADDWHDKANWNSLSYTGVVRYAY